MKDYSSLLLKLASLLFLLAVVMAIHTIKMYKSESKIKPKNKLLKSITNERGYTSVIFINDKKDTVALDSIDKNEFDSLFKKW